MLRQVRSDPALGEIPIIMITAESRIENVIAAGA
jgi:CheY-like chemotaxis protein